MVNLAGGSRHFGSLDRDAGSSLKFCLWPYTVRMLVTLTLPTASPVSVAREGLAVLVLWPPLHGVMQYPHP